MTMDRLRLDWYGAIDCVVVAIIGVMYLYYDVTSRPVVIHMIY